MQRRVSFLQRLLLTAPVLLAACAWDPWIPGEKDWNPDIVVNPSELSDQLPLGSRYLGELSCYSALCERRFRIVVEEPGTLAVSMIPELASDDAQARLALESVDRGVLGQAGTGRGPRTDVPALAVTARVDAGVHFLLLQSIGGPVPYQLVARLTPGAGAPAAPAPVARPAPVEGPPPRLVAADRAGSVRAGYDPAVSFADLATFRFPGPIELGDAGQAGAPLEDPTDRLIRRHLADELTRRGFRQAAGNEAADLLVEFARGTVNRDFYGIFSLYERYGFGISTGDWAFGERVQSQGFLVVDLVDARSHRIAWHARTTERLGPGITAGEPGEALLRAAVTEALIGFPPR